jgi:hypothetical protein
LISVTEIIPTLSAGGLGLAKSSPAFFNGLIFVSGTRYELVPQLPSLVGYLADFPGALSILSLQFRLVAALDEENIIKMYLQRQTCRKASHEDWKKI